MPAERKAGCRAALVLLWHDLSSDPFPVFVRLRVAAAGGGPPQVRAVLEEMVSDR